MSFSSFARNTVLAGTAVVVMAGGANAQSRHSDAATKESYQYAPAGTIHKTETNFRIRTTDGRIIVCSGGNTQNYTGPKPLKREQYGQVKGRSCHYER